MANTYILTLSCPDKSGIIAAVSQFIATYDGNIIEANQHSDLLTGWFFMRVEIDVDSLSFDINELRAQFVRVANEFNMAWSVNDTRVKKKVMLLVSRHDHCLSDLLHRYRNQDFEFEIPCVVSNHEDLREFVEWHKIPFHCVGVDQIEQIFLDSNADAMVLARYMQILPEDFCNKYFGKIINIHHSFLPSFVGAKPYHKAYERGVKLIGATCHYVTKELDAGPIIEQDVIRVTHRNTVEDMVRLGRDVEKTVLARGIRNHVQDRVLVCGNKTVVFE